VSDLSDCTASELLDLYRDGDASPVEAVTACLDRIDAVDDDVNAILLRLAEQAMAQAADSTQRWQRGEARPLEGVPFGLKDIIATAGVPTTGGSSLYRDWVPDESASLAERMLDAGGVLLAKLGTFEFAMGGPQNQPFGVVHNPWDLERSPGGSSTGSAAAVAAREMPIAIGSDTGGSIRIPAAWCGVVGVKATFGRVPRHGVMGLSWTCDHAGPLTRTVADAALTLGVISGYDARDATSSHAPVGDYVAACRRPVAGLRFGVPTNWFFDDVHPEVSAAFETAVATLEAAGMERVAVAIPMLEHVEAVGWTIIQAEIASLHEGHLPTIEDRDSQSITTLANAPFFAATDYLRALRVRSLIHADMESAFEQCDVLAIPGSSAVASPLATMLCDVGRAEPMHWMEVNARYTLPFNVTGQPALVMPMGFVDGLPVSLQIVGRPFDEETTFAVAAAYESVSRHHLVSPALERASAGSSVPR
jgi:aspartyl-tRNA(Asn)/glutamyl-tRNA(Gln) amidotransferase subunit A